MKRTQPLRAKKPWRPKRKPLRARSKKRQELYRTQRIPLIVATLEQRPFCELGPRIAQVDMVAARNCRGRASTLHELRKRSQGGSLIDLANCLPSCAPCNGWVEDEPLLAHRAGLVIRRGDAEEPPEGGSSPEGRSTPEGV